MQENNNKDETIEVFDFINENYFNILYPQDLLIIKYIDYSSESSFYRMLRYYYSFDDTVNLKNCYFNYKLLMKLMNNKGIVFYDDHIKMEYIKSKLNEISFLPMNVNQNKNIESTLYVGDTAREKVLKYKKI